MNRISCGLYPTIITPFTREGGIDFVSLKKLIAWFASLRLEGIFAVCQSSEMFFLSEEEKLELARVSIACCREMGMKCVVSGHTQEKLVDQIRYLQALEALKPDAIILVSNRLAAEDEDEDAMEANLRAILAALRPDTRLGIYECPYPYKRPLSGRILALMRADGRFDFVKDTCCAAEEIRARLKRLKGSGIALYNANAATLYESLQDGAAGYSGVMLNMIPEMFALLRAEMDDERGNSARARRVAEFISAASVIEYQNYPVNAKNLLMRRGVIATDRVRNGKPSLTEAQEKEMQALESRAREAYYRFSPHARVTPIFEEGAFFPECHASCVLSTADGVMAVYFAGTHEKHDDVGIFLSVKTAEGWNAPRRIAKVAPVPHWNPVIFEIEGGVRLVFKVGSEICSWHSWHMESYDGGATWTRPMPYGAACGPVRSKPIALSNGELLAPNSTETREDWLTRVDVSTDEGASFIKRADIALNRDDPAAPDYLAGLGAIQPTLWESAPGHVHAFLRTTAGRIYRADSADYGHTFTRAYPTDLPNNNSGIDVASVGSDLYLAMNPVMGNWAERTPLVILKSTDNGAHFALFRVVADECFDDTRGQAAEFSYPSLAADGEALHITFTSMRRTIGYARIALKG